MLASIFLWLALQATAAGTPIDPTTLGPRLGDEVPDFTATDQDGRERTLGSLMGPKGLMLVFYRSAEW